MRHLATALMTMIATSIFWLVAFNSGVVKTEAMEPDPPHEAEIVRQATDGQVAASGDQVRIDPEARPPVILAESIEVGPSGLVIPVAGINGSDLIDTFTQARAGGARRHDAIDIMAEQGTAVLAAADGTVEKIYFSKGGGGNSLYIRSEDGRWIYYYAHLDQYAPGLKEGDAVRRNQQLGTVGSTGNASPDGPHLHFAINRMEPQERWWEGRPINPYPLLAGRRAKG